MAAAHGNGARTRLLAAGDIGSTAAYHVGDESMMLGLIEGVAASGVDVQWTLMSAQPERSSERFGVSAVQQLTFADCAGPEDRERRLEELDTILAEPPARWPLIAPPRWRDALAAIASSDAVIIAGGGNLSQSWPEHVFERAALVRAARRAARPVAITGQTIGPAFDGRTRALVSEVLTGCVFVGLREEHSYRLALELGARPEHTVLQFDDASGLQHGEPPRSSAIVGDGPFIAVTLNRLGDTSDPAGVVPKLAAQLSELGRCTGAAVVLVPHVGDLDGDRVHDVQIACAVIAAAGDSPALRLAPIPSPEQAAWYCRYAQIVVSTRYHPTVFALASGTPALFLYQDRYTFVKGHGALALAGLQGWIVSAGQAALGLLAPAARELWTRRGAVREHLQSLAPVIERSRRQHIAALLAAIDPSRPRASVETIVHRCGPLPEGDWVERAHDGLAALDAHLAETNASTDREAMARQVALLERRASTAEEWAGVLAKEIERKDADLVIAHSALAELSKRRESGLLPESSTETNTGMTVPERNRVGHSVMEACTIVARNYLPYARVFAKSLIDVHPEAHVTVLVVDGAPDPSDDTLFRSLRLEDVIPDAAERQRQTFMYDVTELSTAVKPLLLQRLLSEGAEAVLYFDPDVEVFDSVESLWRLAIERGIVLTPHVLSPIPDDGFEVSDLAVLRAGVFNLGFIGVGAGMERFLDWWSGRLRRHCLSDTANGMFVDQRWLDYVAGLFPHAVVRDPGCNVAYWNLHERAVARAPAGFEVNGRPLRFYHFSGFDAEVPHLLSKHQGRNPRVLLSEQPALRELCDTYAAKLRASGHRAPGVSYGFGTLPDGTPIDAVMRRLYRRALLDAERLGLDPPPWPFGWDDVLQWFNAPAPEAPRLSRYLFGLHQQRADLQRTFPRPYGAEADAYVHWVKYDPWACQSIPASLRPNGSSSRFARAEEPKPREMGRQTDDSRAASAAGLNVSGYFKAELGVGEVARLVASAARAGGIPVATVVNDRTLSRQDDAFELGENGGPYGVTLVCANADEFPRAVDALPQAMTENCHRIGFWFWETEQLPSAYQAASDLLDEVWVATDYVAAAVRTTVSKPVHICPIPIRRPDPVPACRADLGLPAGFVFLFMFDFLSNIHRKNPIGLIDAFCRAFRPAEGPTLVLKSINGHLSRGAFEEVRAATGGRLDVVVMDGYLPARRRDALMNACDCYVSLHRSEGFGLTLAEAMALEKPTIATAYSGNMTFMTPENSFLVPWLPGRVPPGCEPYPTGDCWAEPDLDAAASLMRLVYENPVLARERGRLARTHVLDRLSPERTAAFILERLSHIASVREPSEPERVSPTEPELEAAASDPPNVSLPPETVAVVEEMVVPPHAAVDVIAEQLELAQRDAVEAEHLLVTGIPFRTHSRFGWPGQLLRAAVLRLLRPYVHFEARTHQQHLQSTLRILECLRRLDAEMSPLRGAQSGRDRGPGERVKESDVVA